MKGYLFVSSKKNSSESQTKKIEGIFLNYFKKGEINVTKHQESLDGITLYNFTNEPNYFDYSNNPYHFGLSGDFLKDEVNVINGFLNSKDKDEYISSLGGIFTFSVLYNRQFTVWNNVTRAEPVYWCETPDRIVVGTKALLVHLIAYGIEKPEYDIRSFTSFINNGFYCDENTPFKGVNVLERNSRLNVVGNEVSIHQVDDFNNLMYTLDPSKNYYDEITELFLDSFSYFKKHDTDYILGLTGGKDSRLVVSAMDYLGLNVGTITSGFPDNPDAIVASRIAKTLNIPHKINEPSRGKPIISADLFYRTVNVIRNCEGMLYSYENISGSSGKFDASKVSLGGQGGEIFRGGYAKTANVKSRDELLNHLIKGFIKYKAVIKRKEVDNYKRFLEDFIDSHPRHLNYNDILNSFYLSYRSGRWSSIARSAYTMGSYSYSPFFETRLVKKAQLLKTQYGSNEQLIYNILLRIAPELTKLPFAEDRWSFEKEHPYSRYDVENWASRKPIYSTSVRGGFNWRKNVLNNYKEQFHDVIFANHNSPLFDIVDKSKLQNLFDTKGSSLGKYDTLLWSLYTSSILLSNKWFNGEKEKSRISIEIPKSTTSVKKGVLKNIKFIPNGNLINLNDKINISVDSNSTSIIEWENFQPGDRLYFQLFNNVFTTPPSEEYKNLSKLDGSQVELFFEIEKHLPEDFAMDVHFMQYDNLERVSSQKVTLDIINRQNIYNYKVKRHPKANDFKVAFRIFNGEENGRFGLHQMRVHFYS